MTIDDYAGIVACDVYDRLAKILPCLNSRLDEEENGLNELQQIALNACVLDLSEGLRESIGRMTETFLALSPFAPGFFTDERLAEWMNSDD